MEENNSKKSNSVVFILILLIILAISLCFYFKQRALIVELEDELAKKSKEIVDLSTENENDIIDTNKESSYDEVFKQASDLEKLLLFNNNTCIAYDNYSEKNNLDSDLINKYFSRYGRFNYVGDGLDFMSIDSNYSAYTSNLKDSDGLLKPIDKTIELKAAVLDTDIFTDINVGLDDYGILKVEELTKYQVENWDKIHKELKKSETFKDIPLKDDLKYTLTGMLIMNGKNTSEEDYYNNSRAKTIKVIIDDDKEETIELKDTFDVQLIDLNYEHKDASIPVNVKVEVLDTYEGNESQDVYISDIELGLDFNGVHGR